MAFENVGLNALLTGTSAYVRNAGRVIGANTGITKSLRTLSSGLGVTPALFGVGALGLAGAAAIKFASDFETSMAQIEGLTSTPKSAIAGLEKSILDLAGSVGKTPSELGAGAYFILSSGIKDTASAMEVLKLSAKASAVGLGDTKTVADAVTSVMNAYQLSVGDAAHVTDTLVNIIKLGKGEPAELAQSIGFVIPLAAQMGVEFDQLGAVLATLTNAGLDAATATTALRGILAQLIAPSQESKKVFEALGIDIAQFRADIDRDFIGTMSQLNETIRGSQAVFAALFPDVRGLTGVLSAFGIQGDQTRANLYGIANGAGVLDEAFAVTSKTVKFQMNQAIAELNVALVMFGSEILPLVITALHDFSIGLQFAADHGEAATFAIAGIGLALAWALPGGPIIVGLSTLIGLIIIFQTNNDKLGESILRLKIMILETAKAFVLLGSAIVNLINPIGQAMIGVGLLAKGASLIPGIGDEASAALGKVEQAISKINPTSYATSLSVGFLDETIRNATGSLGILTNAIPGLNNQLANTTNLAVAAGNGLFFLAEGLTATTGGGGGGVPSGIDTWGQGLIDSLGDGLEDAAKKVKEEGDTIWGDAANSWMNAVEQGILNGTVDVLDALDFLENGMEDAARSIVDGLSQHAEQIGEQWQILVDTVTRGAVQIQDVSRLFELGASDSARDFLAFLAGRDSNIGGAIDKYRRKSRGRSSPGFGFAEGGFVGAGRTVQATLHGGSHGEVIVPLGSQNMMMAALGRIFSGGLTPASGGGFRNYGSISLFGQSSDSPVLRAMTRALGV